MKFLPLVLIKQKILRWSPERSRPEIATWQICDEVGGEYSWEYGRFQGINNAGRIVFRNYNGLNEIALWRGQNKDLLRRARSRAAEEKEQRIHASLHRPLPPQPVDWTKTDEPNYKPGQWVN